MKATVLIFGLLCLGLLIFFRYGTYTVLLGTLRLDLLLGGVALLFFALGFFLHRRATTQAPSNYGKGMAHNLEALGLTARELEVFLELCKGLSNQEIADNLHVSEHTVKTHVSNLLMKLGVKRRTQAMKIARELGIV